MIAYYPFAGVRLTISAVFSIAIHALVMLLMTGFVLFPPVSMKEMTQLEVILATSPSDRATEQALLEADKNQPGERSAARSDKSASTRALPQTRALQTTGNAQWSIRPGPQNEVAWESMPDQSARHRTVSAASHEARDAAYLARWRDRVEEFGTQYYQGKIKGTPLSGEVRILVSIGPKGQLLNAQIRQSSGQPSLDALALEILRKAAPFEPLPAEMRTDTDVLEIIRTWKFTAREGLRGG